MLVVGLSGILRVNGYQVTGELKDLAMEVFVLFVWDYSKNVIQAPQENKGNTECYWRGVYFIPEKNFTHAVTQPDQQAEDIKVDYQNGKFLCPVDEEVATP